LLLACIGSQQGSIEVIVTRQQAGYCRGQLRNGDRRVKNTVDSDPIALLLRILDEAYEKKSWHGPNLRGSIRRVSVEQAVWRPGPKRHNIAEIVVHAAYWKYAVRRRLRGEKRGSFALKGSNWFRLPGNMGEREWKHYVDLHDAEHRALRATVAALPAERLEALSPGSQFVPARHIHGVAMHDVYHAGQIQYLKAMQK
jgi:hypothetical protein